jgi:GR25 family glycosyltransferase involved in LPS biosynthesis
LALSRRPSWRTNGLKAAADLTKLDVSIPPQPYISPDITNFFEKNGEGTTSIPSKHGSTIAWLAHLDLLKHVVMAGLSTALILEDDVDWDVRIATQMQRLSDSVRKLLNAPEVDSTPYGTDWDVLWIGHCGEKADGAHYVEYRDDSRVTTEGFRGFSKKLWMDQIPEGHRRLQPAVQPICTFAYAVTAASAQKLLQLLGSGKDEAYDVGLQHQCTAGHLRCFTVVPQVMQHYEPAEGSGYISNINEESGFGKSASDNLLEKTMGRTGNVVQSARCKALFGAQCLAPGTSPDYWGY